MVEHELCYLVDNVLEDSNQFYFDFQQFNFVNTDGEVQTRRAQPQQQSLTAPIALATAQALGQSTTIQSILLALVHNLYFRGLIVENYRFDKVADFAARSNRLTRRTAHIRTHTHTQGRIRCTCSSLDIQRLVCAIIFVVVGFSACE